MVSEMRNLYFSYRAFAFQNHSNKVICVISAYNGLNISVFFLSLHLANLFMAK